MKFLNREGEQKIPEKWQVIYDLKIYYHKFL